MCWDFRIGTSQTLICVFWKAQLEFSCSHYAAIVFKRSHVQYLFHTRLFLSHCLFGWRCRGVSSHQTMCIKTSMDQMSQMWFILRQSMSFSCRTRWQKRLPQLPPSCAIFFPLIEPLKVNGHPRTTPTVMWWCLLAAETLWPSFCNVPAIYRKILGVTKRKILLKSLIWRQNHLTATVGGKYLIIYL